MPKSEFIFLGISVDVLKCVNSYPLSSISLYFLRNSPQLYEDMSCKGEKDKILTSITHFSKSVCSKVCMQLLNRFVKKECHSPLYSISIDCRNSTRNILQRGTVQWGKASAHTSLTRPGILCTSTWDKWPYYSLNQEADL